MLHRVTLPSVMQGWIQKTQYYILAGGCLVVQASPAMLMFKEPICISVPAGIVVRGCAWLQWIFLKTISMHLPISGWVICECTWPHSAECSAVFDQKMAQPPCPTLPIHLISPRVTFFQFPQMKKSSKGSILPIWRRWNKKNGRSTKRHQS